MECPYCGAELQEIDTYGRGRPEYYYGTAGNGIHYPSSWEQLGVIYKCPNVCGFESDEEALGYATENKIEYDNLQDVVCESDCFNGYFYTDKNEELHEGYPC